MISRSIVVALTLAGTTLFAQSPAPTVPPSASAAPAATGVIRGRIGHLDTREPLRGVHVRLTAPGVREIRGVTTDASGRFEVLGLPAARYTLTASKTGFITLQYGQQRPLQPGRPIDLAEGEVLESIDVLLPRGASVTGIVSDHTGEPITGALVQVVRQRWVRGQRQWMAGAGNLDRTDDIGQFRLHGLPPGTYLVAATVPHPTTATLRAEVWSAGVGGATTFYPATTSIAEALAVTVGLGEELAGLSITLGNAARAAISGTVRAEDGSPLTGVQLMLGQQMAFTAGGSSSMGNRLSHDGRFRFADLAPGLYRLSTFASPFAGPAADALVALDGSDIDVALTLGSGHVARGRVVFEGREPPPSLRPLTISISAVLEQSEWPDFGRSSPAREDWSFEISSLSGRRVIRATAPAGWTVKSIRHGGQDVTGQTLDFDGADVDDIEVILTDRLTSVSGQVTAPDGTTAPDATIVLFAPDAIRRESDPRRVVALRPNQQGRFTHTALPPGEYVAVAVEYLEPGEETSPEMLERLRDLGTPFTLEEGEAKTLDLTLAPLQ